MKYKDLLEKLGVSPSYIENLPDKIGDKLVMVQDIDSNGDRGIYSVQDVDNSFAVTVWILCDKSRV